MVFNGEGCATVVYYPKSVEKKIMTKGKKKEEKCSPDRRWIVRSSTATANPRKLCYLYLLSSQDLQMIYSMCRGGIIGVE